ncbi:MAG: hypothetical protein Q4C41_04740, partial [Eggerthellaceae bacterium]|nr:hypothetical protein [Eggerthellaceae bacterium]
MIGNKTQGSVVSAIAAVFLGVTFAICGFAVCCLPQTTDMLSQRTSAFELSPYEPTSLTAVANEVRDFTVEDYGRADLGEEGARDALAEVVLDAARASCAEGSPTAERWSAAARAVVESPSADADAAPTMRALASVSQAYALDDEALDHLTDVYNVVNRVTWPFLGAAVIAAFCLMVALRQFGTRAAGRA